ncbi:hypothetical protein RCH07_003495 [Arthrobacter sp. CG_A4]|nr:hypothetical protein [Arthrobacter sp. CG_A4]
MEALASAERAAAAPGAAHETESSLSAWAAILDVLESAVAVAERTLKDPLGPLSAPHHAAAASPRERWTPPVLTGPLPAEARRRAVALSAAQQRVAQRLEDARRDLARQLHAVSSVPGVGDPSAAIYLDVSS